MEKENTRSMIELYEIVRDIVENQEEEMESIGEAVVLSDMTKPERDAIINDVLFDDIEYASTLNRINARIEFYKKALRTMKPQTIENHLKRFLNAKSNEHEEKGYWTTCIQHNGHWLYATNRHLMVRARGEKVEAKYPVTELNAKSLKSFFRRGEYLGSLSKKDIIQSVERYRIVDLMHVKDLPRICKFSLDDKYLMRVSKIGKNFKIYLSNREPTKALIFVTENFEICFMKRETMYAVDRDEHFTNNIELKK